MTSTGELVDQLRALAVALDRQTAVRHQLEELYRQLAGRGVSRAELAHLTGWGPARDDGALEAEATEARQALRTLIDRLAAELGPEEM